MIHQFELKNFKCFEILKLQLSEITLLSGMNASGKSSLLQSLVLLHQTINENDWSSRLILNGDILKLGTVQDVVNKIHGRNEFELTIENEEGITKWKFSGERPEMSMRIDYLNVPTGSIFNLFRLIPQHLGSTKIKTCETLKNLTYITAERLGPQEFYPLEERSAIQSIGSKGEHAIGRLFQLADMEIPAEIRIPTAPPTLIRQVEAWMQKFFPGCGIDVARIDRMNAVTLGIRTSAETDYHRPINVGFGLTQILPILIAALSATRDNLILIENPEVHLHPAGQALMGQFLAEVARSGPQIVLETHSDHVLNGIRRAVRQKVLNPNQVNLHFFRPLQHGFDQVVSPQLDQYGNIDIWPEGFFDQFDKDMNHFAGWGE